MNDRNLDQLIDAWMDLGPYVAPSRVAEAVRLEARSTRQMPAVLSRWATRRSPSMNNYMRIGAAAAVLAIAAALGYNFLIAPNVGAPGIDDPSPTPSPTQAAIDFVQLEGEGTPLEPGFYRIDYPAPVAVVISVPDEAFEDFPSAWYKALFDWGPWHQSNEARLGAALVANVFADPCDPGLGLIEPAVGPSVEDLADAIAQIGEVDVARSDVTLDGHAGQLLEITGTARPADCTEDAAMFETTHGDVVLIPAMDGVMRIWIVDVGGYRLVLWAGDDTGSSHRDDLDVLLDSLTIEAP